MDDKSFDLIIYVELDQSDVELKEKLTRWLLDDLKELPIISSVDLKHVNNQLPGAKSGGAIEVGTLLVKIAEITGISNVISLLVEWLSRDKSRKLTLQVGNNKLELTGLSRIEQQELIDWFQTQAGLSMLK
jgi:hypothetical protein